MNFELWRHYYRGVFFQTFKRPGKAIEAYQLALRHEPRFARAAISIAHLYALQEQYEEAVRSYLDALRLAPSNAEMHFNLGYIYDRQRKHEQAIAAFAEALRLKPTIDRAWYGMGLAHAALGEHAEAAQAFGENVRRQTMFGDAWFQLGMAHHHARNPERVAEIVRRLRTFEPKRANQLIRDTGRGDLAHLHSELPF